MAFSDSVVQAAWNSSGGRCERCGAGLTWSSRGLDAGGGWEAHHKTSVAAGGEDVESNCEILCQACHKQTRTYGG